MLPSLKESSKDKNNVSVSKVYTSNNRIVTGMSHSSTVILEMFLIFLIDNLNISYQ